MTEKTFQYVKWPVLGEAVMSGWIPHRSLDGTHHGAWSVLCEKDAAPEEWRAIPGYEGWYDASSYGRIRSLVRTIEKPGCVRGYPRRIKGKILKQTLCNGYFVVSLTKAGDNSNKYVSNLVALAFVGPKPSGLEVAHWDGLPVNNRPGNLRYATHTENMADKKRHGTCGLGEDCKNSILTEAQVRSIRRMAVNTKLADIATEFEVSETAISYIVQGKRWAHIAPLPGEIGTPDADARRRENISAHRSARMARLNKAGIPWAARRSS